MFVPFFCHWKVGVGRPDAATVKVAVWPTALVCDAGWVVMAGATFTVSVALFEVLEPALLVTTQRKVAPLSPDAVAGVV